MARARAARIAVGTVAVAVAMAVGSVLPAQASAGSGWHIVHRFAPRESYAQFFAVAVSGSHAWAVGGYGVAGYGLPAGAYWNGQRWEAARFPASTVGEIYSVSADSPDDAWAATAGDILHWHDGRWTIARTLNLDEGPPGPLNWGINAFSPTDVWVFGPGGFGPSGGTWHLHGRTWTRITGAGRSIFTASAVSSRDMWAIGDPASGAILHYSAGSWRKISAPALKGLQLGGIFASSASSVWLVASTKDATGLRLLHMTGSSWKAYPVPWALSLSAGDPDGIPVRALSPDGHGGFWLSAYSTSRSGNWLLHVSSSGRWSRLPMDGDVIRNIVRSPRTRALWAVGSTPQGTGPDDFSNAVIWRYGSAG
jgi:hypothetical protein